MGKEMEEVDVTRLGLCDSNRAALKAEAGAGGGMPIAIGAVTGFDIAEGTAGRREKREGFLCESSPSGVRTKEGLIFFFSLFLVKAVWTPPH